MPERFFIGNSVRGCSTSEQLSLLCGPPGCGKTFLLFQFAFNCAAESGGKVVFICSKKRLEHKPPFLPQDIDPASEILGRIQMKYVEDDVEIKKYFAAFHLLETFPVAVIIDDFGDFFIKGKYQDKYGPRDREAALAHALALCQNAISHANSKLQPCGSCKLLISDTQRRDNASLLFIYKIWVQSIFIIEATCHAPPHSRNHRDEQRMEDSREGPNMRSHQRGSRRFHHIQERARRKSSKEDLRIT